MRPIHSSITNSNLFIEQFSTGSFAADPFLEIAVEVEQLQKANTVPLKERIQLIEKLSYCILVATSQIQQQQNLNFWARLLKFFGFSSSEPLPDGAVCARAICKRAMEELSKRQKDYESIESSAGSSEVGSRFAWLRYAYTRTIERNSGCGQRGQHDIDAGYLLFQDFVAYHPEYQNQLPERSICQDDGTGGLASGLTHVKFFE